MIAPAVGFGIVSGGLNFLSGIANYQAQRQDYVNKLAYKKASDELSEEVEKLIKQRSEAKENKNFELADEIRNTLEERGIEIKDTPEGTSWKVK